MDSRTLKIFIACAFGGGIGALVALQMHPYLWWVGMIVGGLTGYLSYEYEAVLAAIPRAWQKTVSWRPDWKRWRIVAMVSIYGSLFCFLWLATFGLLLGLMGLVLGKIIRWDLTIYLVLFSSAILSIPIMLAASLISGASASDVEEFRGWVMHENPIPVFWKILKRIFTVIACIPLGVYTLYLFLKNLVVIIHSDIRLLCGVDATLGAGIGYFTGNALVGALAGGLLGVVNYEVVSKKILKIVPIK